MYMAALPWSGPLTVSHWIAVPRNWKRSEEPASSERAYSPPDAPDARTVAHRYEMSPSGTAVPPTSNPSTATAPPPVSTSIRIVCRPEPSPAKRCATNRVVRRKGKDYAMLALMPDDPSLN